MQISKVLLCSCLFGGQLAAMESGGRVLKPRTLVGWLTSFGRADALAKETEALTEDGVNCVLTDLSLIDQMLQTFWGTPRVQVYHQGLDEEPYGAGVAKVPVRLRGLIERIEAAKKSKYFAEGLKWKHLNEAIVDWTLENLKKDLATMMSVYADGAGSSDVAKEAEFLVEKTAVMSVLDDIRSVIPVEMPIISTTMLVQRYYTGLKKGSYWPFFFGEDRQILVPVLLKDLITRLEAAKESKFFTEELRKRPLGEVAVDSMLETFKKDLATMSSDTAVTERA